MSFLDQMIKDNDLFKSMSDDFKVERNNNYIFTVKGFFCGKERKNTIQLLDNIDIKDSDWLLHIPSQKRYYVCKTEPISVENTVINWFIEYLTESEFNNKAEKTAQSMSINIGTISGGAIVGSQQNASINISYTTDDLRNAINDKPKCDQELLTKLVDRLDAVIEDNQPISKGFFAKFSDVLSKHSDIVAIVGNIVTSWLTHV